MCAHQRVKGITKSISIACAKKPGEEWHGIVICLERIYRVLSENILLSSPGLYKHASN